jgi:hypothetical protein
MIAMWAGRINLRLSKKAHANLLFPLDSCKQHPSPQNLTKIFLVQFAKSGKRYYISENP